MFPRYLKNVFSWSLFKSRPKQSPHIVFSCCVSSISGAQSTGEGGLSEHWILPLHCPAWPRPRSISSALNLTPSQASLLQPLHSVGYSKRDPGTWRSLFSAASLSEQADGGSAS